MARKDTKERILDAAERLFANEGIASTSLRTVTSAADANLAAVNYHFGSKEALVEAVISRRLDPLNRKRIERLDALERRTPDGEPPDVEAIAEAFVGPVLEMGMEPGGQLFMRLMGHAVTQPADQIREIFSAQFREVAERFVRAISPAVPHLPPAEIFWRLLFMGGAMAHAITLRDTLARVSGGRCEPGDDEALLRRLVPFLAAGLQARGPVVATGGQPS